MKPKQKNAYLHAFFTVQSIYKYAIINAYYNWKIMTHKGETSWGT